MRAMRVDQFGGPEALRLVDIPEPTAGPGEVVVRHEWIGVNFVDTQHRAGSPFPVTAPIIVGTEAAGVIEAVGEGVDPARVGEAVAYTGMPGVYAEMARMPAEWVIALPDGVATRTAAASLMQGTTAHYLASDAYPCDSDTTAVVLAAAGGVGRLLVQIARLRGARVVAVTSSPEKGALCREDGAHEVIVAPDGRFAARVREFTDGRGAQVVYDSLGKLTFRESLAALSRRGFLVCYGQATGEIEPFRPVELAGFSRPDGNGSLYVTWTSNSDFNTTPAELAQRTSEVFTAITRGDLRHEIVAEFPLERAADAHRLLESRTVTGKILLSVAR